MSERMSEANATVPSPLGVMSFRVHGSASVTIGVNEAKAPRLPNGMAVDGVMLVNVDIATPVVRGAPLLIDVTVNHEGHADTGEWLESMSFRTAEGVLQVGTRDPEWLGAWGIVAEYVDYGSRGFRQTILEAAAGTTLYVSVVWRIGELAALEDDVSTWFAAELALPKQP